MLKMTHYHLDLLTEAIEKSGGPLGVALPDSEREIFEQTFPGSDFDFFFKKPESPLIYLKQSPHEDPYPVNDEDFEFLFEVEYLSQLRFQSLEALLNSVRQYPKVFETGLLSKQSQWSGAFYKDVILGALFESVYIGWIGGFLGYGLFARLPIKKDQIVGEYTGLVRSRGRLRPNTNDFCMHYPTGFWHRHVYMIDAEKEGNYSRFINHSEKPALVPQYALFNGVLHVLFQAIRDIPAGEELTLDYGPDYWQKRKKIIRS